MKINYKNGKIIKFVDLKTNNVYYDITCSNYVSSRMAKVKDDYLKYLEKKKAHCMVYEILKNNSYTCVLVENYECKSINELKQRLNYWIENEDCINNKSIDEIPKWTNETVKPKTKKTKTPVKYNNRWRNLAVLTDDFKVEFD